MSERPGPRVTAMFLAPALLSSAALFPLLPADSRGADVQTLAWVEGTLITTRDLDLLLAEQERPDPAAPTPAFLSPDGLLKRLIQNRLLEEEGYRIGLDEEPEVRDQVWDFRVRKGLVALLDSVTAGIEPPDSVEMGAAMDQTSTMWRVSHIRLEKEATARALLDSLSAGVPFGELARRHSADTTSARSDGDLGWAREDLYVPEFRTALTGLAKGAVTGPVQVGAAWHLLMLADVRTETVGQSTAMREKLRQAAFQESVAAKVREYVASLRVSYGLVVNDSLLASLDYGSADSTYQKALKVRTDVLAVLPWRQIEVQELTRRIRFQYFHGIQGKPDAAQIRDKVFEEWLTELLLRHETQERGFDKRPDIMAAADELERSLVREEMAKKFLDVTFAPTPEEIERYWAEHPEGFTPAPRVRLDGVLLADEASARRFREQVDAGATLKWLAERTPGLVDPKPAAFADWVNPVSLGLGPSDLSPGRVVGPFRSEGAWAVVTVVNVETVRPVPLDQCRDRVIAVMKRERTHDAMTRAIDQLEAAANIRIAEDANGIVQTRIDEWLGRSAPGAASPPDGSGALREAPPQEAAK